MPPRECSQSASENSPAKASMTIRRASSRVSLSRSAVWTRRAVWTPRTRGSCVCTLTVYQRASLVSLLVLERPAWTRPVQRHLDCAAGRTLAGQLTVGPAVLERHADQPHADPVGAVGDLPVGADQDVRIEEPVVARAGNHVEFEHLVFDGGHWRLVQVG